MFIIPKREIIGNRLKIISDKFEWLISIPAKKTLEHFVIGMFENQTMKIYDKQSEAIFYINTIEAIPEPKFRTRAFFKTLSPVVLSKWDVRNGKETEKYLDPSDPDYFNFFKRNLLEKYITYTKYFYNEFIPVTDTSISNLKILTEVKSKLITIKEGLKDETKVKAYMYGFELEAESDLLRFVYEAGVGKLNSLGFGFVRIGR